MVKQTKNIDAHAEEFKRMKTEYEKEKAWGLLTSLDLRNCNPKTIRDDKKIKQFVDELCQLIEMKKFGPCTVVDFGEDPEVAGFSMTQLIETSLISGHFANKTNRVFLDVFSCKFYNPYIVLEFAKKFFEADNANLHHVFRK